MDLAHSSIISRNRLLADLLDIISSHGLTSYSYLLHELSDLKSPEQHVVSLRARRMLIIHQLPSFEQMRISMERDLLAKQYNALLSQAKSIFHILTAFFTHSSPVLRETAVEVYLRRAYHAYEIQDVKVFSAPKFLQAEWHYVPPDTWFQNILASPATTKPSQGGSLHPAVGLSRTQSDLSLKDREAEADMGPSLQRGIMFLFHAEEDAVSLLPELISKNFGRL